MKTEAVNVRLQGPTKCYLDLQLARINKERNKKLKPSLTRGDLVALALEHLTVQQGVDK